MAVEPDPGVRISCVLPAYNEAESLGGTVAGMAAALQRYTRDYEIIVVDDGSTDGTPAVLRDLTARHAQLRVLTHPSNRGYGSAIRDGFARASFPLLFFTDADGQYDPEDLRLLLEGIHDADIVVGHRLQRQDALVRRVVSRGFNVLVGAMLGLSVRDINCAFKLMHRDVVRALALESTQFCINAELLAGAQSAGMTVVEVGVRHRPRQAGRSTVRASHVWQTLYALIRIRRRLGRGRPVRVVHSTQSVNEL